MKKVILKKINSFWILLLSFFYLEFVFKILLDNKIWNINLLNISLFLLFLSLILKLLSSFIKNENFNKIIFFIFLFLICFIHAFELTVYKVFGFYYDLSLLGATAQVMEFASEGIIFILRNIVNIFLMLIPFILSLIFSKYIDTKRISLEPEEFEAGLLNDLLEQFILDYKRSENND